MLQHKAPDIPGSSIVRGKLAAACSSKIIFCFTQVKAGVADQKGSLNEHVIKL